MTIEVQRVWVRGVASSVARCERADPSAVIDAGKATRQHRTYIEAIAAVVGDVCEIPADEDHPDCVFIEDTAVVIDHQHVVLTRPGAASRRGEVDAVARALGETLIVHRMPAPARLDGGDVLRATDRLFIGMSRRTDDLGADFLAEIAWELGVRAVKLAVPQGLHLKSACSLADATTILYDPAVGVELSHFRSAGLECVAAPEALGANVLALGGKHVLVSSAAPRTAELADRRGLQVTRIDTTEVNKADGALTCPSLRIPPPGGWAT